MRILSKFLDVDVLQGCIDETHQLQLSRYDNPFERKWFLENKATCGPNLVSAFTELKSPETCKWVSRILDVPIDHADFIHYGGLFVYGPGDYLKPHVDAGIHPHTRQRKIATALLYLTPAEFQTYNGDSCTTSDPTVWSSKSHWLNPNELVLFANHDTAWHGVPITLKERIVLTVSYMTPPAHIMNFTNPRTRAFFTRFSWEAPTPELLALRNTRASENASKVYRSS